MWKLRISTLIIALVFLRVNATSSGFGNNPGADVSSYVYSEISSVNYMPEPQEYYSDEDDLSDASASVVASSLLYEGGCLVSSQAMMCYGGDRFDDVQEFDSEDFEQDSDDDDDDDDDNDGHSSMLSNASLRRSRAFVSVTGESRQYNSHPSIPTTASNGLSTATLSQGSNFVQRALSVRGGGGETMKSSQVSTTLPAPQSMLSLRGGVSGGSELSRKLLVAAIVTLSFEFFFGHWIEFFKIGMQTSPAGTTYLQLFRQITGQKGITGIWDGFAPWGVVQAILKGGVFGLAYGWASSVLIPLAKKGYLPMQVALTLAGGFGGGFQGYVLSPTLLLKTRVMTNPAFREQMSLLQTTWLSLLIGCEVVRDEGLIALMKGANVFALKRVLDWGSRYYFSESFEALLIRMKKRPLTASEKSFSSLMGGVASTIFTLPLDVLVAKLQDAKNAGTKGGALSLILDEFNEKGWSGMQQSYTKGFVARLFHVSLTTVVMKTGAPIVYDLLFKES